MQRIRTCWNLLFFLYLLGTGSAGHLHANGTCPSTHCLYTPILRYPRELEVQYVHGYGFRASAYIIHGEIYNSTSSVLYNLVIETRVRRVNDTTILTSTALLPAIWPEEHISFQAFTGYPFDVLGLDSKVISWSTNSPEVYLQATVLDVQMQHNTPDLNLQITIRNDNAVPIYSVEGAAWSLPSYSALNVGSINDMLAPGETMQWTTVIEDCYECLNPRVVVQGTARAPNP
jgi:hypothetical protein